jgi:hypothetical protein
MYALGLRFHNSALRRGAAASGAEAVGALVNLMFYKEN